MSDRALIRSGELSRSQSAGNALARPGYYREEVPGRARARGWLLFAAAIWGVSFPLAKALAIAQLKLVPGASSWFLAALAIAIRFGAAAVILAFVSRRILREVTRRELSQGIGLGVFAGGGMLLQLDGLTYTTASTSAFLTSCYCVIIPVIVGLQRRKLPPPLVLGSCGLVAIGMALLAGVDWRTLRLGRGEMETFLCSIFFAAQIFWLERPVFAGNRTSLASLVMFATLAVGMLPVLALTTRSGHELATAAAGSGSILAFLLVLTLVCTLAAFLLMNHWQRYLEATEAGLIYCAEPVMASLLALFLPAWLAVLSGIHYANETASWRLLLGGGLITVANICIQLRPRAVTPVR
jgi:drug/metabolite transporter (DMT)-like permease